MPDLAKSDLTITKLGDAPDALGESPVWDCAASCLWWIDGVAGTILRLRFEDCAPVERFVIGGHIGGIALASEGRLIVARGHEFLVFDPDTKSTSRLLYLADADTNMRLNDTKLDRQGRLICAGMGRPGRPLGDVHQVDCAGQHSILASGLQIGNGVCFSPDGRRLYFSDTSARKLFICDYDPANGHAGPHRVHIDTASLGSGIDGATVDRSGNLWATFIHSAEIACFSPDKKLLCKIPAPTDLPSSLTFGGPNMQTLFVTSIRDSGTGRAVSQHLDGGHVFAIDGIGATGLSEAHFKPILDIEPIREPL